MMEDYKKRHPQQQQHQPTHLQQQQNRNEDSERMERYPRDLLQGFAMRGVTLRDNNMNNVSVSQPLHHPRPEQQDQEEDEELELNLGLSLGGRFGVDKNPKKKKLMRSSSVVGTMPLFREDDAVAPPLAAFPALMRTSSLPTETEEEWRRRKEMQTLRRMEAKRRRSEKQKGSREAVAGGCAAAEEVEGGSVVAMGLTRFGSATLAPPPLGWGVAAPKQVVLGDVLGKGKGFQGLFGQPSSQGSADSQGGSSSSVSEMDSKAFLGGGEASPASNQSAQDGVGIGAKRNEHVARSSKAEVENPSKKTHHSQNIMGKQIGTNSMEDMPCVFTKGDGPNGRRIEGILYKYGKGEEVRIMCVCHGNFLSPAEFVKHAGGGDVAHPLRHIVVNPSAASF
ncbi:ninja-family protein AFP1-like isoform X2 [Vigna umbellata]|uniref:ninja-family protein AFP1-like isoform X2 n=1 Tax=Vigna umbellata TaxID=87088 RepID=UPI001F5FD377|nr:ninja-family protein AFP1-like isoform X2 [Vigna umbellata]